MSEQRTEISSIGEFGLIDKITQGFVNQQESTIFAVGDDAAVLAKDHLHYGLLSTDMLVEGIHFDLAYTPLMHLGYKAVASNLSDIAAMNGIPTQITVSLAISNRFSLEAIETLYQGIKYACNDYKVDLVGGDTTSSLKGLLISVSVLGQVAQNQVAYRSGAQKGDILCVTGDLGASYLGLQVLRREKVSFVQNTDGSQPDLSAYDYIVGRHLKPKARTDIVHQLAELAVVPTSMIDVSDGLASELLHICKASQKGAVIFEKNIPIDKQVYDVAINEFKISPAECALNGGEDYELLFTIKQEDHAKIKHLPDLAFIGYIHEKEKGVNLVTNGNQTIPISPKGWNHFSSSKS